MKKIIFFFSFCLLFLAACNNEENLANYENQVPDMFVKNGCLVFKSQSVFDSVAGKLLNFTDEEREIWERNVGFISQSSIIKQIVAEETALDSINSMLYRNADVSTLQNVEFHSDAYKNALNKEIITVVNQGTEEEYWTFSAFEPFYLNMVNEKGIYYVGDTLYQVKVDGLEMSVNGNATYIQKSNAALTERTTGWVESGKKRMKATLYYQISYQTNRWKYRNYIRIEFQEKNWMGSWKVKDANDGFFSGTTSLISRYADQEFSVSTGRVNFGKVSSIMFGIDFPNRTIRSSTAEILLPVNWGSSNLKPFLIYEWNFTRNGGCCGVHSSLKGSFMNY